MNTIYNEFNNSMSRIKNNFMLSSLSVNFINQKPFSNDIIFDVSFSGNYIPKDMMNNISRDTVQEYGNSIRRHFLNDMVIAYERYASLMYISDKKENTRYETASFDKRESTNYQNFIYSLCENEEKYFLKNLVNLRNSIIHYNGLYTISNPIDYTFGNDTYKSSYKEGQNITINFDNLLWIYEKLINIVTKINLNYFDCSHFPSSNNINKT
ncbi:MAG: hypothetical protein HXX81_04150 [Campylobacterales bacterium]|nr:hypothetical protein [Campylobacterales bacterium]